MKQAHGWWFPDNETHLIEWMEAAQQRHRSGRLCYQLHKYNRAMEFVPADRRRVAVDVGAHVGQWSWLMAQDFFYVDAFEPVAQYSRCWHQNMLALPHAYLAEVALGSADGRVNMCASTPGSNGDTHVALGKEQSNAGTAVPMSRLDAVREQMHRSEIDFLKIDCEGYELEVIRGGEETIRRCKPIVIVEQKPGHAQRFGFGETEAVELLKSWGAKLRDGIQGDFILSWDAD